MLITDKSKIIRFYRTTADWRAYGCSNSVCLYAVCLSVRPSVTCRYCKETA